MAQAPDQKAVFVPDSSEPRRIDTEALTTDAPLPVRGTRQGIGLSHRGDLGCSSRLIRARSPDPPVLCTAVSGRRRVTWRPTVRRTAGSGDPHRTKGFRCRFAMVRSGVLTRPSSATAVSDRRRVTWRPTVGQTAGSGDPRRTVGRSNGGVWIPSPYEGSGSGLRSGSGWRAQGKAAT